MSHIFAAIIESDFHARENLFSYGRNFISIREKIYFYTGGNLRAYAGKCDTPQKAGGEWNKQGIYYTYIEEQL
jgi:hypothetical protein